MKELNRFFENLKFPQEVVPNGATIWYNTNSDSCINKILHRRYAPLSDMEIATLQNEINTLYHTQLRFPDWYKDFLKKNNGVSLFFGAISLFGMQVINRLDPKHETPFSLYVENLSKNRKLGKNVLIIGSYGYDNTSIAIDTLCATSKIFCVYHETNKIICEWNNFDEFIKEELDRLQKRFNVQPWNMLMKGRGTLPVLHKDYSNE